MALDPMWLFLSLIPGGVGFVLFVYGKKRGGGAESTAALLGVGAVLGFVTWAAIKGGW